MPHSRAVTRTHIRTRGARASAPGPGAPDSTSTTLPRPPTPPHLPYTPRASSRPAQVTNAWEYVPAMVRNGVTCELLLWYLGKGTLEQKLRDLGVDNPFFVDSLVMRVEELARLPSNPGTLLSPMLLASGSRSLLGHVDTPVPGSLSTSQVHVGGVAGDRPQGRDLEAELAGTVAGSMPRGGGAVASAPAALVQPAGAHAARPTMALPGGKRSQSAAPMAGGGVSKRGERDPVRFGDNIEPSDGSSAPRGAPGGTTTRKGGPAKPSAVERVRSVHDDVGQQVEDANQVLDEHNEGAATLVGELGDVHEGADETLSSVMGELGEIAASALESVCEILDRVPLIAPVAKAISLILKQSSEASDVKSAAVDLEDLVKAVLFILRDAANYLRDTSEEEAKSLLDPLRKALEEGGQLAEKVKARGGFARFIKAKRDSEDMISVAERINECANLIGAKASLGAAHDAKKTEQILTEMKTDAESKAKRFDEWLAEHGGVEEGLEERLQDDKALRQSLVKIMDPEQQAVVTVVQAAVVNQGQEVKAEVKKMQKHLRAVVNAMSLKDVVKTQAQEAINALPPLLEEFWTKRVDSSGAQVEVTWQQFKDKLTGAASAEGLLPDIRERDKSLSGWYGTEYEQRASKGFDKLIDENVKDRVSLEGKASLMELRNLAQQVQLELKIEGEQVDLSGLIKYVVEKDKVVPAVGAEREKQMEELKSLLQPGVDINHDIRERLKKFMDGTRKWMEDKVLQWVRGSSDEGPADSDKNVFLVLSNPGMGKTSLSAHLARVFTVDKSLLAAHFVRVGDHRRIDSRSVIKSLAYQVASNVVEATRPILEAARVYAKRTDLTELFEELLLKPLEGLGRNPDGDRMVLLIDALDEGRKPGKGNEVLNLLQGYLTSLPRWIRIVVTGRPEKDVIDVRDQLKNCDPYVLEPTDEQNWDDLRMFVRANLRADLETKNPGDESDELGDASKELYYKELVDALVAKSQGIFAYIARVVEMTQTGRGNFDEMRVMDLPEGLGGLYKEYMDRQFDGVGGKEKVALTEKVLPALCVAAEPMDVRDLWTIVDDAKLAKKVIERLGSLFPVNSEGKIEPFHKSVLDWLLAEESEGVDTTRDSKGEWHVEKEPAHAVHAECWLNVVSRLTPGSVNQTDVWSKHGTKASPYCLSNALHHGRAGDYHAFVYREHGKSASERVLRAWGHWQQLADACRKLELVVACAQQGLMTRLSTELSTSVAVLKEVVVNMKIAGDAKGAFEDALQTVGWLRAFAAQLSRDPDMAVEAALLAPESSWMRRAAKNWDEDNARLCPLEPGGNMTSLPGYRSLAGHSDHVYACTYTPDGAGILSASADHTVKHWNSATGELMATFKGHKAPVCSVAVNPVDGVHMAVSGSKDKTCRLWDLDTGQCLGVFEGVHSGDIWAVSFSPDGKQVVSGALDAGGGLAVVWDVDDVKLGKSGSEAKRQILNHKLHDFNNEIVPGKENKCGIYAIHFADELTMATGSEDETTRVWDRDSAEGEFRLRHHLKGHTTEVTTVRFSPDGKKIATSSWDKLILVYSVKTGETLCELKGHQGGVNSVVWTSDGQYMASGAWDFTVRWWDCSSSDLSEWKLQATLRGHSRTVQGVALSPDDSTIASAAWDTSLRLWDLGSCLDSVEKEDPDKRDYDIVSLSPRQWGANGWMLATGSTHGSLFFWDYDLVGDGGWPLWQLKMEMRGHEGIVRCIGFDKDGSVCYSGGQDGAIYEWCAETGRRLGTYNASQACTEDGHPVPKADVLALAVAPDGKQLVSAHADGNLYLWSGDDSAKRSEGPSVVELHRGCRVMGVVLASDGSWAASCDDKGRVFAWPTAAGPRGLIKPLFSLDIGEKGNPEDEEFALTRQARCLALSPDGRLLCVGLGSGHVVVVVFDKNENSWRRVEGSIFMGTSDFSTSGTGGVNCLTWNAAGEHGAEVIAGYDDGAARVWSGVPNMADGGGESALSVRVTLKGHVLPVISLTWMCDGSHIVTGSPDGNARLWTAQGDLKATMVGHNGHSHDLAFQMDPSHGRGDVLAKDGRAALGFRALAAVARVVTSDNPGSGAGAQLMATAPGGIEIELISVETGAIKTKLKGHTGIVHAVSFGPKFLLASGAWDSTVRLWNTDTERELWSSELEGHTGDVTALSFERTSPDWRVQEAVSLVSGSADGSVILWSVEVTGGGNGADVRLLQKMGYERKNGNKGRVNAVAMSGGAIAGACVDGTVRLWDAATGKETDAIPGLGQKEGKESAALCCEFSPDGALLAVGASDGHVFVYEVDKGRSLKRSLKKRASAEGAVLSVAWSPIGDYLITGCSDSKVRLWSLEDGAMAGEIEGLGVSLFGFATTEYSGSFGLWIGAGLRSIRASAVALLREIKLEGGDRDEEAHDLAGKSLRFLGAAASGGRVLSGEIRDT